MLYHSNILQLKLSLMFGQELSRFSISFKQEKNQLYEPKLFLWPPMKNKDMFL